MCLEFQNHLLLLDSYNIHWLMAILCFCCVYVCLGLWYTDIILYIFVIIQQELIGLNARIQGSIEDRERVIQSLPQVSQAHKVKTSLNNHVRSIAAVC